MDSKDHDLPDAESIRVAFITSWKEHQHTRDQTWKALQLTMFSVLGMIITNQQFHSKYATLAAAILTILLSLSGISLTLHHRKYQSKKFSQIANFEKELNISQFVGEISEPRKVEWYESLNFIAGGNTPVFIIRMYVLICVFCTIFSLSEFRNS